MPSAPPPDPAPSRRVLLIACGALVREVRAVVAQLGDVAARIDVEYLPAPLHNRPERILVAIRDLLHAVPEHRYARIALAYADCGTGGGLERACTELSEVTGCEVVMLRGAHCYELFAGRETFAALHDAEPGTFYLTDFLARHADALVFGALGLDRHPELRDAYFGNYRRVCLLSQSDDPELLRAAEAIADRLGLELVHHHTGMSAFADALGAAMT
jgi:hypothetical protein